MSMIQIRNVPEKLHHELKLRALKRHMSLSDFLLSEIKRLAARPDLESLTSRISNHEPVGDQLDAAVTLRKERDRL
jgi:antitoxin FitA